MVANVFQSLALSIPEGDPKEMLIPLILVIVLGLFITWWYWNKHRRKMSFKKLADKLSFDFVEYPEERVPEELENVPMAEDFYYVSKYKITGTVDSFTVSLFDLTVVEFEISKNFTYSALTVKSDTLDLPLFTLKPRMKIEDNIAESRGVQFPDDFDFTRMFRIDALDNDDVRKALNPAAREIIRPDQTMSIIGKRDTLFLHKYPGHMSIAMLEKSMQEGIDLVKALTDNKE